MKSTSHIHVFVDISNAFCSRYGRVCACMSSSSSQCAFFLSSLIHMKLSSFSEFPFPLRVFRTPAPILDADRANAFSLCFAFTFAPFLFYSIHSVVWYSVYACVCEVYCCRCSVPVPDSCLFHFLCVFLPIALCVHRLDTAQHIECNVFCVCVSVENAWNSPSDEYKRRCKCVVGVIFDSTIDKQTALASKSNLFSFLNFETVLKRFQKPKWIFIHKQVLYLKTVEVFFFE